MDKICPHSQGRECSYWKALSRSNPCAYMACHYCIINGSLRNQDKDGKCLSFTTKEVKVLSGFSLYGEKRKQYDKRGGTRKNERYKKFFSEYCYPWFEENDEF